MSSDDVVLHEVDDAGVATITLNRPDKLNAMTGQMQQLYCRLMVQADQDPGVRAIIVTGAGRGFCAGADLGTLEHISERDFATGDDGPPVPFDAPMRLATPVIAAVNGPVAGMGFSYMLMADLRFAADSARIGSTFARLGLVAEWGSAPLLTQLVGSANAADLLLSGRIVDADEALRLGLVQRVVPGADLLAAARAYARDLAQNCAPASHAVIKEQLRDTTFGAQFQRSMELMLASFTRPDLRESLAARAEKRPPRFEPYPR